MRVFILIDTLLLDYMAAKFTEDPNETLANAKAALLAGCQPTWAALSRHLEIPRGTLTNRMNALGIFNPGEIMMPQSQKTGSPSSSDGAGDYYETIQHYPNGEIGSDKLISVFAKDAKDPDALLVAHGFEPDAWELVGATSNMWHGMRPNDAGQLVNMQSKIRVRPLRERGIQISDIEQFFAGYAGPVAQRKQTAAGKQGGAVVELCLADLHIGNGTPDIAERAARIISQFIADISGLDVLKIYLVPLGDYFHYDTLKRTTSGGTPLEANLIPSEMYILGEEILIDAVDRLADVAPVEVVGISGNHDAVLSFSLYRTLKAYYRNTLGVFVDAEHGHTKHREFGKSLVLWSHGDVPNKRLQKMIYHEAREEFGRTNYAEIHCGHLHTQTVHEEGGIILRRLPTLTNTDEWHKTKGFVGSLRASMGFVWDLERGLKRIMYAGV